MGEVEAKDLHPVEPHDASVVDADPSEEGCGGGMCLAGEGAAEEKAGVVALHVRDDGAIVIVAVSDGKTGWFP